MKKIVTILIVLAVLVGGYFLLKGDTATEENTGDVSATSTDLVVEEEAAEVVPDADAPADAETGDNEAETPEDVMTEETPADGTSEDVMTDEVVTDETPAEDEVMTDETL